MHFTQVAECEFQRLAFINKNNVTQNLYKPYLVFTFTPKTIKINIQEVYIKVSILFDVLYFTRSLVGIK